MIAFGIWRAFAGIGMHASSRRFAIFRCANAQGRFRFAMHALKYSQDAGHGGFTSQDAQQAEQRYRRGRGRAYAEQ